MSFIICSRSPVKWNLIRCIRGTLNMWTKWASFLLLVTSWLETYNMYSWDLQQVNKMSLIICSRSPVDLTLRRYSRRTINRLTKLASLLVRGHQVTRNVQEVLVGPYTGHNEHHYMFKVTNWLETYRMHTGTSKRRAKLASITFRSHQRVWNLKDVYVGLKSRGQFVGLLW